MSKDHITTTRDANGRQFGKTLHAETMRCLLYNKIGTDASIEVGPSDGDTVTFHAHTSVLMSHSEVFKCMFSSGMSECSGTQAKVRVEDIDPDIFKELLNYIYYETASMCSESAAYLIYAAKKYMVPKLVEECRRCLMESLDVNNAIHLLDQSLHVDEQELQSECLRLISANATAVLTGTEIFSASRLALEAILEADTLPVRELIIYETAVKWAKHQLQSEISGEEDPTDFQIREALGDLLYKIRFPVMKPTEFAEITAGNDLLTAEEKESVYYYLVTKKKHSQLKFPTERRIGEEVWIDSTVECTTGKWSPAPHLDAITFVTDKDILLTGIGLNLGYSVAGYDVDVEILGYDVDVESLQSVSSMFKQLVRIPRRIVLFSTPCKISLDKPIGITAGVIYSVKALSHVNNSGFAKSCRAVCVKDSVTFTFFKHSESQDNPEVGGQIPRMYFCKAI